MGEFSFTAQIVIVKLCHQHQNFQILSISRVAGGNRNVFQNTKKGKNNLLDPKVAILPYPVEKRGQPPSSTVCSGLPHFFRVGNSDTLNTWQCLMSANQFCQVEASALLPSTQSTVVKSTTFSR